MTKKEFKRYIESLVSEIEFTYNGKDGCVDPLNRKSYYLIYDGESIEVHSIEEVMNTPYFDGKSLDEIFDDITDIEAPYNIPD